MTHGRPSMGRETEGGNEDFMTQLRKRTQRQHNITDSLINLSAPIILSSPKIYRQLLVSFYYVYQTIEEELETRRLQYPKISPIYFRELLRMQMFKRDLAFYFGSSEIPPPSPAARDYVAELKSSVEDDPIVLIAYTQSMYFGLLLGGSIIRQWIIKAFSLTPPVGCAIFEFSETISDTTGFRRRFADAVNSIALSDEEKERVIRQKQRVYLQNDSIIREVCSSRQFQQRLLAVVLKFVAVVISFFLLYYLVIRPRFVT